MKRNQLKKLNAITPKYRAKPTIVGGQKFASKKEARRFVELRNLERAGRIQNLRCQVSFDFIHEEQKICRYVADFVYLENGAEIVEDCKGFLTPVYRLKRKMMKIFLGIEIRET